MKHYHVNMKVGSADGSDEGEDEVKTSTKPKRKDTSEHVPPDEPSLPFPDPVAVPPTAPTENANSWHSHALNVKLDPETRAKSPGGTTQSSGISTCLASPPHDAKSSNPKKPNSTFSWIARSSSPSPPPDLPFPLRSDLPFPPFFPDMDGARETDGPGDGAGDSDGAGDCDGASDLPFFPLPSDLPFPPFFPDMDDGAIDADGSVDGAADCDGATDWSFVTT
mmetsp:Transcript_32917/g.80008  ORF Transcript_32917/g.80008 Transcript_32917/m.80008 type:complete len:222 (-) Transcript_32917:591-1256(-)